MSVRDTTAAPSLWLIPPSLHTAAARCCYRLVRLRGHSSQGVTVMGRLGLVSYPV